MTSTNRKQAIRDYMKAHGVGWTEAAREVGAMDTPPPTLVVGQAGFGVPQARVDEYLANNPDATPDDAAHEVYAALQAKQQAEQYDPGVVGRSAKSIRFIGQPGMGKTSLEFVNGIHSHMKTYPDMSADETGQAVHAITESRRQNRCDDALQQDTSHTLFDLMQELIRRTTATHERPEPHPFTIEVTINKARCSTATQATVMDLTTLLAEVGRAAHIAITVLTGDTLPRTVDQDAPLITVNKCLGCPTPDLGSVAALTDDQVRNIHSAWGVVAQTQDYLDGRVALGAAAGSPEQLWEGDALIRDIEDAGRRRGDNAASGDGYAVMSSVRWAHFAAKYSKSLTIDQFGALTTGWRAAF